MDVVAVGGLIKEKVHRPLQPSRDVYFHEGEVVL
jgi:hypothetical protein